MTYDPSVHHRRSIRLPAFDYSRPGAYFVTLCTQQKRHLFGEIVESEMRLNEPGQMIQRWWTALPRKFPTVEIDSCVVMPNHIHAVLRIVGMGLRPPSGEDISTRVPLPRAVQWFKTMTTNDYLRHATESGWPPLAGKVWQRDYYEHIIRNADELNKIRESIITNPLRWEHDRDNPAALSDLGTESPWL